MKHIKAIKLVAQERDALLHHATRTKAQEIMLEMELLMQEVGVVQSVDLAMAEGKAVPTKKLPSLSKVMEASLWCVSKVDAMRDQFTL